MEASGRVGVEVDVEACLVIFPHTGDRSSVKVGAVSNVQDQAVISTVSSVETGFPPVVDIGHYVTIGQSA
jgi:carbonic anhydrase/acetyltransferase-like protein (isoleucine patch superfamily)